MKKLFLLLLCSCVAICAIAQTQQGYVRTIGKPGKPGKALSGVTVRAKGGHNAVVSRADGTFSMQLPGQKNGQAYALQQVQKQGYELNDRGVIGRQYAYSSTVPLTIVMVSTAQLQADKQRIENNAYKTAEKNYKAKMTKLEKQLNDMAISEEQYFTELQEIQVKFERYQGLIDELAEHYAHTDYDVLDEKVAEINVLIENGELEQADSLIHTMFDPADVLKRNREALSHLNQTISEAQAILDQANADMAAVLKQQEKDAEYLYLLYTIALAQFDNEKASQYIMIRAALDTTNIEWQNEAGRFVQDYLENYPLAMKYYQQGLLQTLNKLGEDSEWAAILYNNIGGVYSDQDDFVKAMEYYQKSIGICERVLGTEHPYTTLSYNNIGTVFSSQGDYGKALECYHKALDIQERVLGADHPYVAHSYRNIAFVYYRQGDYARSIEYLIKSYDRYLKSYGPEHRATQSILDNINYLKEMMGQ